VFNQFISKFKKLFIVVVKPNKPLLYESEEWCLWKMIFYPLFLEVFHFLVYL
jgi:hypothetical protein